MIILHYGAIVVAALASFFFGWLWYSPLLFQNAWMKAAGIPNTKPVGSEMTKIMFIGILSQVVMAGVMDIVFQILGVGTMAVALRVATLLWLGFVATISVHAVLWEKKPWKLYVINNGYHLLSLLLVAAVLFSVA